MSDPDLRCPLDTELVIVLEPDEESNYRYGLAHAHAPYYLPIELCSGDASIFLGLSRFGIVCRRTRREGDRKKALSHLLLAWLVAIAVSDTVWNSVLPL